MHLSPQLPFAAVRSKAVVVLLLLIHCVLLLPLRRICVWLLIYYAVIRVFSKFAILFLMSCDCYFSVSLRSTMFWVGLKYMVGIFCSYSLALF